MLTLTGKVLICCHSDEWRRSLIVFLPLFGINHPKGIDLDIAETIKEVSTKIEKTNYDFFITDVKIGKRLRAVILKKKIKIIEVNEKMSVGKVFGRMLF